MNRHDEPSWWTVRNHDDSWFIMINHHDSSAWFIIMNHDDASRWIIMIHHDDSWWFSMIHHHDESWWLIMMNHHDASWWFIMNSTAAAATAAAAGGGTLKERIYRDTPGISRIWICRTFKTRVRPFVEWRKQCYGTRILAPSQIYTGGHTKCTNITMIQLRSQRENQV